jgi:hypothetical protein
MSEMFTEQYTAYPQQGFHKKPVQDKYYHIFIHKIVEKLNEGKDVSIIFCGEKGNGKTYGALRLIEILYNDLNMFSGEFDPQEQVIYDPLDYLDQMRQIDIPDEDDREDNINPDRKAFLVDEAGLQLNKSDYYGEMNDAFADMLDIQRKANCLVIYALPVAGNIDSRIKDDIDFVIEMKDQGVASVTGFTFQHARLDEAKRMFVNYNRQESILNKFDNNGLWKFDEIEDQDMLLEAMAKVDEFKRNFPEEKYQELKKKREEEEGEKESENSGVIAEALQDIDFD